MSGSSVRTWWQISRPWLAPWARSAIAGMVVFGVFHQFLVEPTLFVFLGIPMALALSTLIVAAFAAMRRSVAHPSGIVFGLVVFAGFVPHYGLITVAMWDRTVDDGPRGGWEVLALASAPLTAAVAAWVLWRSTRAALLLALAVALLALMVNGFQVSEPDRQNVGALVSMLPATISAGWILARSAPSLDGPAPAG